MEIECDGVGNRDRNFPDNASSRISPISDDHNFHGAPDVSQIENGLGQVHFPARGNDDRRVKDFPAHLTNSLVPVADFCNETAGAGKTLFHRVTTFRADQQRPVKPRGRITDRRNDTHVSPAEGSISAKARVLTRLLLGGSIFEPYKPGVVGRGNRDAKDENGTITRASF